MSLRSLFAQISDAEKEAIARDVGFSVGHLRNVMYGSRECSPLLASRLERVTRERYGVNQMVKRQDLIPLWREIWPEIADEQSAENATLEVING